MSTQGIKLITSVTFSFSKLKKKLDKEIPEIFQESREHIAKQWRKNIDNQKFTALAKSTKKRRKYKGYNSFYPNIKPKDTTTILKATGKFYDSIKATKKGIKFNRYGDRHVKGDGVPRRNWMTLKGAGSAERIIPKKRITKLKKDIKSSFKMPKKDIKTIQLVEF